MKLPWPEVKLPTYVPGQYGPWKLSTTTGAMPGYFTPDLEKLTVPALRRKEKGKEIVWMSLANMERESHMPHIAAAYGHTVVMGLGMGMYLYNIIRKPQVTRVTVIERDERVYTLLRQISDYDKWPGIKKVNVIIADARSWETNEHVDFLYADFWKHMADSRALAWVKKALINVNPCFFGYWTQEMDFVHYLRERKININYADVEFYDRFAESIAGKDGPRMIGQGDKRYVLLCCISSLIQTATGCAVHGDMLTAHLINSRLHEFIDRYNNA